MKRLEATARRSKSNSKVDKSVRAITTVVDDDDDKHKDIQKTTDGNQI
jgi:hypothetical protein